MKRIKIKYVGFWNDFNPDNNILVQTIKKYYEVEETDDPDYIICSVFDDGNNNYFLHYKYPQVRIMFCSENYIPDFNTVDYAMSPYPLKLQDRHLYYPYCLNDFNTHCEDLLKKERNYTNKDIDSKCYFANFIVSHDSENNIRGDFFKKLCQYKRVESAGTFLNNMPNNKQVNLYDESKTDFQRKCKFTICFESTKHEGFITEKITDAFYADTIPIYYGSTDVKDIFNAKAFINCSDYSSFDEVIAKIIELDQDDEKYLSMINQPIFVDSSIVEKKQKELEDFVRNIFDQPIEKAYRRSRVYRPAIHEFFVLKLLKKQELLSELQARCNDSTIVDDYAIKVLLKYVIKRIIKRIKYVGDSNFFRRKN